jgi:small subunit ribosomal protein S20
MPIIKSAKKKMRKDKKRTDHNISYIKAYKEVLNKIKKKQGNLEELVSQFYCRVDRAVKRHIIHKNKAKRLKARISHLVQKLKPSSP